MSLLPVEMTSGAVGWRPLVYTLMYFPHKQKTMQKAQVKLVASTNRQRTKCIERRRVFRQQFLVATQHMRN